MRHELFALEQAAVYHHDSRSFHDFNLHIYKNEILGIICDSISQEQALICLFRGDCRVEGTVRFSRKPVPKGAQHSSFQKYFFLVGDQVNLIPSLSVPENICMFSDRRTFIHSADYVRRTREYLEKFDISLDISRPVESLAEWEKLIVVLLKACAENRKIIVFANVSERISESEYEPVYRLMRKMIPLGYTFVIIDSIETNIFNSADKVMVIRSGTSIACFDAEFFDRQSFYNYMLQGQATPITETSLFEDDQEETEDLAPAVIFQNVSTAVLQDISFQLSRGEILKILCLDRATIHAFHMLTENPSHITAGSITIGSTEFHAVQKSSIFSLLRAASRTQEGVRLHSGSPLRTGLSLRSLLRSRTGYHSPSGLPVQTGYHSPSGLHSWKGQRSASINCAESCRIAWCPRSPYENAIIETMSIRDNLLIPLAQKVPDIFHHPGFSQNIDQFLQNNLGIHHPQRKAWSFSSETLQKVAYTRFLIGAPKILFIEDPFTETNVRIRETTLEMLKLLQRRGIPIVLLISSPASLSLVDGDELYAKNGRIISEEEMYRSFYGG